MMIESHKMLYFIVFAARRMVKGAATLTSFALVPLLAKGLVLWKLFLLLWVLLKRSNDDHQARITNRLFPPNAEAAPAGPRQRRVRHPQ